MSSIRDSTSTRRETRPAVYGREGKSGCGGASVVAAVVERAEVVVLCVCEVEVVVCVRDRGGGVFTR